MKLSQIAAECGVSVQAIRKWCKRNNVETDNRNHYIVSDTLKQEIVRYYKNKGKETKKVSHKVSVSVSEQYLMRENEILREQIKDLKKLVEKQGQEKDLKDKEIAFLMQQNQLLLNKPKKQGLIEGLKNKLFNKKGEE